MPRIKEGLTHGRYPVPPGLPGPRDAPPLFIGSSDVVASLHAQIDQAARSDAKVLVTGETGSGKEVVARLIHQRSARHHKPLAVLNCAGVPESLLESELFGHVRGAFTGALRDQRGKLEIANGGTIFLDEIGETSLRMQAVLLRFLESGEIQRVGATRTQTATDVRMICATNRNLTGEIAKGTMREDFYYRISVVSITVPPLRERLSDLPQLVDHLLALLIPEQQANVTLAPETLDLLTATPGPATCANCVTFSSG